uniref:Uncharacterized protein n=1 Tax=Neisseria meningitidis alpha275 TaxID=295996 RepID=C6SKF0_NEIME|nr:hypothetical protein predicted by Glimmer/Critica [Neisseria meningitidis alpha275]
MQPAPAFKSSALIRLPSEGRIMLQTASDCRF